MPTETRRNLARRLTAHEVAARAGLSVSAVSRTFTSGASVAPATRERVLAAAQELGYRPNLVVQMTSSRGRSGAPNTAATADMVTACALPM